ncbi:MAG: hypothetical protein EBZ05_07140, partial [Verrucomicrobia bacterium]|nr:hypothetical protein [Verrucomicrobiota bacterium]
GANEPALTLINVSVADAGVYTAAVTNMYGTTTSAEATVAINAVPVLTRPLNNAVATAGDPVVLSADFVGYPPPAYTWRKNGTVIAGASGSSYSFLAAADSGGTYSVTADNGLGTASSSATVTLEEAASGLLSISSTNASITENFDSLGKSTTNGVDTTNYLGWTNGAGWLGVDGWTNKPGWYAVTDDNRSPFEGYRSLNYGNGNPSTPPPRDECGLASMGSASSYRERALGALPWTNNRVFFGVRLSNATGFPLQGFSVRYRMEQYSATTTAALSGTKLTLAAAVNPISLRSTNFINFGTNAQIVTRSSSYGRIDGTSSGNNALRTNTVTGLGIAPGDSVWVRWEITSSTTNPLAFAIDDLVITNFMPATQPVITTQPAGLTNVLGQAATFNVAVSGGPFPTLQWFKNGVAIPGATAPSFTMDHVAASDAGNYSVQAANVVGSVTSASVPLVVTVSPRFVLHPIGQTVKAGASVSLTASASGSPAPAYQWQKDGEDISGATGSSLTLYNVSPGDSGNYSVSATNEAGFDSSDLVPVWVLPVTFAGEFGGVAPESDSDRDGISALLEYAFGGATNRNDADRMPQAASSNNELSLTYFARTNDTNLSIVPERTTDLSSTNSWTNTGITVSSLGTTNIRGTDFERRKAALSTTNSVRQFLRLKVKSN